MNGQITELIEKIRNLIADKDTVETARMDLDDLLEEKEREISALEQSYETMTDQISAISQSILGYERELLDLIKSDKE